MLVSWRQVRPFLRRCWLYRRNESTDTIHKRVNFTTILQNIDHHGRNKQFLAILRTIESTPLDTIVEAAINDSKRKSEQMKVRPDLRTSTTPLSISYIFQAFIHGKSEKLARVIELSIKDIKAADYIGSKALFDACIVLHDLDKEKAENSEKLSNLAPIKKISEETGTEKAGAIFLHYYTQWLLTMNSSSRIHHTVDLLCYKNENFDRGIFYKAQLQYLHFLGRHSEGEEQVKCFTAWNDVALSGFMAALLFRKDSLAMSRIKTGCLISEDISKEAFSLAVASCLRRKTTMNGVAIKSAATSELFGSLLAHCSDNTFKSMALRDNFLQVLLSREMYSTLVEYSLKFRIEGLLLGTRSCNLLISAYVGLRDFDSAYDVLNILESEEEYVRYRGCKTFSELSKADSFAKHAQEMLIVKEAKKIEQEKMAIGGGGKDDGEGECYDKDGKYLEDIFAHRRRKYSVITVGVTSPKVAFANSDDDNNDSDNGSSNDKSSRLNKSISERFAEERKKKRLEKKPELSPLTIGYNEFIKNNRNPIPHFGVNVHTFTALICNPYLNINSRNYYSPTKNERLPDGEFKGVYFKKEKVTNYMITLLDVMIQKKLNPDVRLLGNILAIGKAVNSSRILFRTLNIAKSNFVPDYRVKKVEKLQNITDPVPQIPEIEKNPCEDYQTCELFVKKKDLKMFNSQEMIIFYETVIVAKMEDSDIQMCELLLNEILALNLTPSPLVIKKLMQYYIESQRYEDCLRIFEQTPGWGGERTYAHGSIVITALIHMGRIADAWRGAEMLFKDDKHLSYTTSRDLIKALIKSLGQNSEEKKPVTTIKRKLSRKTQISAIVTIVTGLLKIHDKKNLLPPDAFGTISEMIVNFAEEDAETGQSIFSMIEKQLKSISVDAESEWNRVLLETRRDLINRKNEAKLKSAKKEAKKKGVSIEEILYEPNDVDKEEYANHETVQKMFFGEKYMDVENEKNDDTMKEIIFDEKNIIYEPLGMENEENESDEENVENEEDGAIK